MENKDEKIAEITSNLMLDLKLVLPQMLYYTEYQEDGTIAHLCTTFGDKIEKLIIKNLEKSFKDE